jgi:hypothetical protein
MSSAVDHPPEPLSDLVEQRRGGNGVARAAAMDAVREAGDTPVEMGDFPVGTPPGNL